MKILSRGWINIKEKFQNGDFLTFIAQKGKCFCNMYLSMPERENTVPLGHDAFKIFCIYENKLLRTKLI
jgi:hypothetical protein